MHAVTHIGKRRNEKPKHKDIKIHLRAHVTR